MRWIAYFTVAVVAALCVWGLVHGFALVEARLFFLALIAASALWLLGGWGERYRRR